MSPATASPERLVLGTTSALAPRPRRAAAEPRPWPRPADAAKHHCARLGRAPTSVSSFITTRGSAAVPSSLRSGLARRRRARCPRRVELRPRPAAWTPQPGRASASPPWESPRPRRLQPRRPSASTTVSTASPRAVMELTSSSRHAVDRATDAARRAPEQAPSPSTRCAPLPRPRQDIAMVTASAPAVVIATPTTTPCSSCHGDRELPFLLAADHH